MNNIPRTDIEKFHCSDIAASMMPNSRVRWGQSETGLTLLVTKDSTKESSNWQLVYCPDEEAISISPEGRFGLPPESLPRIAMAVVKENDHLPAILEKAWTDYFVHQVPPPRYETNKTLVPADVAAEWEQEFYNEMLAPYVNNHAVYAVAHSGVALCNRLGIDATSIFVTHYDESTYQNDEISDDILPVPFPSNSDTPILIIDDMISSGRTADSILKYFKENGYQKLRYVALYNVLASNEVPEVLSEVETFKTLSNFYWVYGRGMDLFSFSSRKLEDLYGAEKRYFDFESEANVNELREFFGLLDSSSF